MVSEMRGGSMFGEAVFDRIARFYDHEQKEFTKDIPFYLEYAKKYGGEVLELACGTGRILVPLARQGIKVTGLDASDEMLNICRKKIDGALKQTVTLVRGDMISFELPKRSSMVFVAFRSFQCLLTKEDQISCLQCVWKHLSGGGILIIDLFAPRHDLLAQVHRSMDLREFYDAENDVHVNRRADDKYDLARQTLHEDRFYEWTDKSGEFHCQKWSFDLSYLFRYEAELLIDKCGFRVEAVFGDFDRSPYDYFSGEQIFVARKE
jgi:ubiquinone/menaquinone biosynthesis C-methylase UbiE